MANIAGPYIALRPDKLYVGETQVDVSNKVRNMKCVLVSVTMNDWMILTEAYFRHNFSKS